MQLQRDLAGPMGQRDNSWNSLAAHLTKIATSDQRLGPGRVSPQPRRSLHLSLSLPFISSPPSNPALPPSAPKKSSLPLLPAVTGRPLPPRPPDQKCELSRRQTFHMVRPGGFPARKTSAAEHIYEEILSDDGGTQTDDKTNDTEEVDEHSFLALISSERRRNLKFYGLADWDYGSELF